MPVVRDDLAKIRTVIAQTWGFSELRPLQEEALRANLSRKDVLVVLPTGGGKSLCYQAPPILRQDTTLVVSPLIALMKDQVDSLRQFGIPAVQLNSSQTPAERAASEEELLSGRCRLVFVAPERLGLSDFQRLMRSIRLGAIAIDEAHCISHWGHDFRPEYRQLSLLRTKFPNVPIHAFTATATEPVRQDILQLLGIPDAPILVGNFDRANLIYRILPREDVLKQTLSLIEKHPNQAGIVYCLRRKDVEELCSALQKKQVRAEAYHAGLPSEERQRVQEAFKSEACDIVVATVAFGMGIDRPDVRFVLHTSMPKSLEHYQQEAGRAGRDGLRSECVLLYSGGDIVMLRRMMERSASESNPSPEFTAIAEQHLEDINRYCCGAVCRHKVLVQYFGQDYSIPNCEACDLCLGEIQPLPNSFTTAQMILSAVARTQERYGSSYIADVLYGKDTEAIRRNQHQQLSVYGLLKTSNPSQIRNWLFQLVGQQMLDLEILDAPHGGTMQIPKLNPVSWQVMRGKRQDVRLIETVRKTSSRGRGSRSSSQVDREALFNNADMDQQLFEGLRQIRSKLARDAKAAPYMIFHDSVLCHLAIERPTTLENLSSISGIGQRKVEQFGQEVIEYIAQYCQENGLSTDQTKKSTTTATNVWKAPAARSVAAQSIKTQALELFEQGLAPEQIAETLDRALSTIEGYLVEMIQERPDLSLARFFPPDVYQSIQNAIHHVGTGRLKPVFEYLGGSVPYSAIKLVMAEAIAQGGYPVQPPA